MEKSDLEEELIKTEEGREVFSSSISINNEEGFIPAQELSKEETKDEFIDMDIPARKRKETIVIRRDQWRDIRINTELGFRDQRHGGFRGNKIKTSKYTILNFLPKNLFIQFTKSANVYFLIMVVLQCIPAVTITQGQPTILVPLGFVTLVSMVKDIIEDYKRYSSDTMENNRKVLVIPQGPQIEEATEREGEDLFKDIQWRSVSVGQICKIKCDEYFPADMILLNSDDPQGICYVETKNLDGETNMKHKVANKKVLQRIKQEKDLENFIADKGIIEVEELRNFADYYSYKYPELFGF